MITNNRIQDENTANTTHRRKNIENKDCCIIIIQYVILTVLNICIVTFMWNYIMVIDMLNNLDCKEICLSLSLPNKAGIISPNDKANEKEEITMLIMPVMLNND